MVSCNVICLFCCYVLLYFYYFFFLFIFFFVFFFFFQAEDGIRDADVTGVQTCALPISSSPTSFEFLSKVNSEDYGSKHIWSVWHGLRPIQHYRKLYPRFAAEFGMQRSEEHTSELQSRPHLVCRLLLEKKKQQATIDFTQ